MSEIQRDFWESQPFPCLITNDFFPIEQMVEIQQEILSLSDDQFERYENMFESGFMLRDKKNLPIETQKLFEFLRSDNFLEMVYHQTGLRVENDEHGYFCGIHKFKHGDKTGIHLDAVVCAGYDKRKVITFGLYLTRNYKEDYQGHFEMWSESEVAAKVPCYINHAILFSCTDNSWHGNPTPYLGDEDSQCIFLTTSYVIDENDETFKKVKEEYSPKFENTQASYKVMA